MTHLERSAMIVFMEQRMQKLEEFASAARDEFRSIDVRLTRIESGLAELRSSTKADLAELNASLIKWIVGTVLGAGAVAITVMTFVLNHAVAKPMPPAPPAGPLSVTASQLPVHLSIVRAHPPILTQEK